MFDDFLQLRGHPMRVLLVGVLAALGLIVSQVAGRGDGGGALLADLGERWGWTNSAMLGVDGAPPLASFLPVAGAGWRLRGPPSGGDPNTVTATYDHAEGTVTIRLDRQLAPSPNEGLPDAPLAERAAARAVELGLAPVSVHGAAFYRLPATGPALYAARIGRQITVTVRSDAPEETLAPLLAGLDMAGLERHADADDPTVDARFGVLGLPEVAAPVPLTAVPPTPGPGEAATGPPPGPPGAGCRLENGARRCTVAPGG